MRCPGVCAPAARAHATPSSWGGHARGAHGPAGERRRPREEQGRLLRMPGARHSTQLALYDRAHTWTAAAPQAKTGGRSEGRE
jgi:hypothetical protein